MSEIYDTPTTDMPALREAIPSDADPLQGLLIAMRAVLQEMKILSKQVETMTRTVNANVTDAAVIKVRFEAQDSIVKGLTARVEAMEAERDELTKSVLAKAITLVLVLTTIIGAAIAYLSKKTGS